MCCIRRMSSRRLPCEMPCSVSPRRRVTGDTKPPLARAKARASSISDRDALGAASLLCRRSCLRRDCA